MAMHGWQRLSLSLLIIFVFAATTLSVCSAHLLASEHPDCARCLIATSSRREDGTPAPLPVTPHHCPDHACSHLHTPFIIDSSSTLISLSVSWFLPPPSAHHRQELPSSLFRPPQT